MKDVALKRRAKRDKEATFPKCWCGNTAGVGQTLCGAHREAASTDADLIAQAQRMVDLHPGWFWAIVMQELIDLALDLEVAASVHAERARK